MAMHWRVEIEIGGQKRIAEGRTSGPVSGLRTDRERIERDLAFVAVETAAREAQESLELAVPKGGDGK
jgi:hypothetical protein